MPQNQPALHLSISSIKEYSLQCKQRRFFMRKEKLKSKGKHVQDTQKIFNKYIRTRDEGRPCISCGREDHEINHDTRGGKWDCGHYLTTGSFPELRFHTSNANRQCKWCNRDKSGDQLSHRKGIIARYGWDRINYVEGPHEAKRYTIENLNTLQRWFKRKTKRLLKELEQ